MGRIFILGSTSTRRLSLLEQINFCPDHVLSADIDETPTPRELPRAYVARVSALKLHAIQHSNAAFLKDKEYVLLCADTTVAVGRRILGKPANIAEAKQFLMLMSGRRHRVFTCIHVSTHYKTWFRIVETQVQFKQLSCEDTEFYLESQEWQGKAGGYAIQGIAQSFIPKINGSYSNVVGLPLVETRNVLLAAGVKPQKCAQLV